VPNISANSTDLFDISAGTEGMNTGLGESGCGGTNEKRVTYPVTRPDMK